jgi:two-component system invasion response regulator UvrY
VLLLDLSLPDMSGLDVLRRIKSHHDSVATLVLSAYPEKQYGLNVLRAGASGFVSKTAARRRTMPRHPRRRARRPLCESGAG